MEEFDIYKDVQTRTGGNVYIGVVGPVRCGKSTFITSFMNTLVLNKIANGHEKTRMIDELPQSADGNGIMTTQPKFVPNEAVEVVFADNFRAKVRLVDCVGYLVDGASGHEEDGRARMVYTPWSEDAMPFEKSAEFGTRKVITDHSTVGIVLTTDGTIGTGIERSAYEKAEERVVSELKSLNKPFVIVVNSVNPDSKQCSQLCSKLSEKYSNAVVSVNAKTMKEQDILRIFQSLLMEFPLKRIDVKMSKWLQALPLDNPIIQELSSILTEKTRDFTKMNDYIRLNFDLESENFDRVSLFDSELGEGRLIFEVHENPSLFYRALSSECGCDITDDFQLMASLKELVYAKKKYDKISNAIECAEENGYGIVSPSLSETVFDEPQIEKKGARYGVKLKAKASTYHILKVDVDTEVSPLMGAELHSEETVKQMLGTLNNTPEGIWKSNMFGKSLEEVVSDNLSNKTASMQDDTKNKMRKALSRIVNEGKGGVICILL